MKRRTAMVSLAAGMVVLAGCAKKAEGQVAAVVNGEEITLQEVNTELGADKIPEGAPGAAARQAALRRIVQRRLLAQAARDDGLDKSPDYLFRRRALEDALLVQLLGKKIRATIKVPDQREIDGFIKDHATVFGERAVMRVDRIRFNTGKNTEIVKQLAPAHSMDDVVAALSAAKIQYGRDVIELDTARMNPQFAKQILSMPAGEPFIVPEGGMVMAGVVTGKREVPIVGDQARPLAVNAFREQQLDKVIRQRLDAAEAQAKIEYQSGFAPPKTPPAAKGQPGAK